METDTRGSHMGTSKKGMFFLPTRGRVRLDLHVLCFRHGQDKAVERRTGYLQAEDTPCRRVKVRDGKERINGSMAKRVDHRAAYK